MLGVAADASPESIRRAYLKRVRAWHPDRFPNDPARLQQAEAATKLINEAYATLSQARGAHSPPGSQAGVTRKAPRHRAGRGRPRPDPTVRPSTNDRVGFRGREPLPITSVLLIVLTVLLSVLASLLLLYVMVDWL
ncbi:MAG: J domain-containing protein [Chloroflexota bacterium]|nr:J domain-containing protein [Chloroflexota bacterium]